MGTPRQQQQQQQVAAAAGGRRESRCVVDRETRGNMSAHFEAARPPSRVHATVRIGEGLSGVAYDHVYSAAGSLVAEEAATKAWGNSGLSAAVSTT